ncbi:MAG: hypothetical protein AB7K09_03545 [Planctomycetota bacterium]
MKTSTFPIVLVACILSALVAVAAASIIVPPAPANTAAPTITGLSKAEVESLLSAQKAEFDKQLKDQQVVTVVSDPKPATDNAGAALQAKDDEIAELKKNLDETTGRLLALEQRFNEYEASEQRRQLDNLQDAGRGMMRQGMDQLMERAPELMQQFSGRITDSLAERLGLDDSQKEAFGNRMKTNMESFLDMMKKVQSGEMTQEQAREEMQRVQQETEDEMRQTLTPEQFEKFQQGGGANFWRQGQGGQGGNGGGFGGFGRGNRNRGGNGGGNNNGGNGSGDGF